MLSEELELMFTGAVWELDNAAFEFELPDDDDGLLDDEL